MSRVAPQNRLDVLNAQHGIELQVAQSTDALAVFFVPVLPTPLYIDPEAIIQNPDGLFVLKPGFENAIPDGLIPAEKQSDPLQLSTVLARVISMHQMLANGVKMMVLYVNPQRPKADHKAGFVDDAQIKSVIARTQLKLVSISDEIYTANKTQICAATYCFFDDAREQHIIGIDAPQIQSRDSASECRVLQGDAIREKTDCLNQLFAQREVQLAIDTHYPSVVIPGTLFGSPVQPRPSRQLGDGETNTFVFTV